MNRAFSWVIAGLLTAFVGQAAMGAVIIGPISSTRATLIYDSLTGDLQIDPNGFAIRGFDLYSHVVPTETHPGDTFFNDAETSFPPGAVITSDNYYEKFWVTLDSSYYFAGVVDLGRICPTGLSAGQFAGILSYSDTNFDSHWSKPAGGTFDFNLTVVPEPSSLAFLSLGIPALLRRKKPAPAQSRI